MKTWHSQDSGQRNFFIRIHKQCVKNHYLRTMKLIIKICKKLLFQALIRITRKAKGKNNWFQKEENMKLEVRKEPGIHIHGKLQLCHHLPAHFQLWSLFSCFHMNKTIISNACIEEWNNRRKNNTGDNRSNSLPNTTENCHWQVELGLDNEPAWLGSSPFI